MQPSPDSNGNAHVRRYRLPGIKREGIAQLSILETALWPLRGGKLSSSLFETSYEFSVGNERRTASVTTYSPDGFQSIDEYVLWGLLGISLSRPQPETTLLATPYWIIKQLGMTVGGFAYDQLRASLERLATVAYKNTGFFNPLTQQHERVTLHFLSSFIPTQGRGGVVATERAWRIEWDKHFFELAQMTGGSLLFDLDLYRELTPASRRLFLKLKDRFWRSKRVHMNVDDLTINGLGFSAGRPLFKRKFDLTNCIRELLDHQIIELGRGQSDPQELFLKRSKGCCVVVFYEGEYFRQAMAGRAIRQKNAITTDPLYEPLCNIGIDAPAIRRLLTSVSRSRLQTWIKITEAAMHEKPQGFPGFRKSPAAFFIDAVSNERMPPDWVYAHEKRQAMQRREEQHAAMREEEQSLHQLYEQERHQALQTYLHTAEGRSQWDNAFEIMRVYYERVEPHRAREAAADAANGKIERDHLQFPDFGVWVLERHSNS